jgi:hypothetical protein
LRKPPPSKGTTALATKWDAQSHWHLMLPPSRPSARYLDFVRTYVERAPRQAQIAVLGSTPELRDLCVEAGQPNVHVLERSSAFHAACSQLLVYDNPRETLHLGDWLEVLPSMSTSFDLILSDLTLGNVPYERRSEFFSGISGALRPSGFFLDKVLTHPRSPVPLDALDEKYRSAPFNLQTLNDFSNEYFFLSELTTDGTVDIQRFHGILASRFKTAPRLRRLLEESLQLVTANGVWHYGRPWQEVQRTYARGMRLVARRNEVRPSVFAGRLRMLAFAVDRERR